MAKRWVTVNVTEDIIKRADPGDCYGCLVALALREATGFVWHVVEDSARIEVICGPLGKLRPTWYFPDEVRDLIRRFDRRFGLEHVEPTTFRLPTRFADKKWLDYGAGGTEES